MKNRDLTRLIAIISVCLSFLLQPKEVHAERIPVTSSPEINIVNDSGEVTSGPEVDINNLLMVNYVGGKLYPDFGANLTLQYMGVTTTPAPTGRGSFDVKKGGMVRVKNAGIYQGKPVTLAVLFNQDSVITLAGGTSSDRGYYAMIPSAKSSSNTTVEMSIFFENSDGQRMTDPNIQVMFPYDAGNQSYKSGTWMYHNISKEDGISNIFIRQSDISSGLLNNVTIDDVSAVGTTKTSINMIQTDSGRNTFNFIYNLSDKPLKIKEVYSNSIYPIVNSVQFTTLTEFAFFDKNAMAFLKLKNNAPNIIDTINDDTFQMKIDVTQDLLLQSTDNFYQDFQIAINVPMGAKTEGSSIKVTDYLKNDISNQVTFDTSTAGKILVNVPKTVMSSLGVNSLNITAVLDLSNQSADLMQYYDKDNQYFDLPVTVKSQDSDIVNEAISKVKMPTPTGEAVSQTVTLNQSTKDLDVNKLVKNLSSSFEDDSIVILGLQEDKTFTEEGQDSVVVKIKSELTSVEGTITVPITVIKEEDKAILSWSDSSIVSTKDKSIDKSDVIDLMNEKLFWQTSYLDKKYQLIVTSNGETIATKTTETSTEIAKWVSDDLDIPINKLNYGENQLTIDIFSLDSNDKVKGNSLSQLTLTVNLSGSLQLKTVPADLSWTKRTSRESKGILSRDSGNMMTLEVVDTRNLSEENKKWSLRSNAVSTSKSPIELIWKNDETSSNIDLTNQVVLTKDTSEKDGNVYAKTWNENVGILLSSASYLNVGDYSGQIVVNWQLYDTDNPG